MTSAFTTKLVDFANDEWDFFGRQEWRLDGTVRDGKKEYQDGAWQRVGDYWRFIGQTYPSYANLTGKDRGYPWSAAFISYCMSDAGAGTKFPYSPGHATYINKAISNAKNGTANAAIVGHKPTGYTLKPGDLIGYWRGDVAVTYDKALQIGWYTSHTDVVVEVGNKWAKSIGGNVGHSVTKREVRLSAGGNLTDTSENWFVVIENKL